MANPHNSPSKCPFTTIFYLDYPVKLNSAISEDLVPIANFPLNSAMAVILLLKNLKSLISIF